MAKERKEKDLTSDEIKALNKKGYKHWKNGREKYNGK